MEYDSTLLEIHLGAVMVHKTVRFDAESHAIVRLASVSLAINKAVLLGDLAHLRVPAQGAVLAHQPVDQD